MGYEYFIVVSLILFGKFIPFLPLQSTSNDILITGVPSLVLIEKHRSMTMLRAPEDGPYWSKTQPPNFWPIVDDGGEGGCYSRNAAAGA